MQKEIEYNGKKYTIEIKWATENYVVRAIGVGGFQTIPLDCLNDIEKIKPHIIKAIEHKPDLHAIIEWDGKI